MFFTTERRRILCTLFANLKSVKNAWLWICDNSAITYVMWLLALTMCPIFTVWPLKMVKQIIRI